MISADVASLRLTPVNNNNKRSSYISENVRHSFELSVISM